MADIMLYTHEKPGAGLTSINVGRVKGAVALRIITEGFEWKIPLKILQSTGAPEQKNVHPTNGKADFLLQTAEKEVNLAKCKGAVALTVSGIHPTATIYWIVAGQCSEIKDVASPIARSEIEGRCCPEYELPPQL